MKNSLVLFTIFFLSCSPNKEEEILILEQKPANKVELKINGEKITDEIIDVSSFYICDEKINVSVKSKKGTVTSELFTIEILRNGELSYAKFVNKKSFSNEEFSTPDYIPSSTIRIEEFEFVANKKLKIKFGGTLLKRIYNLKSNSESIEINGIIEINEFGKSTCNTFNDYIKLNDQIKFSDITRTEQESSANLSVRYESNSLNGYNIQFKNFTKFLTKMSLGTYYFDDLSNTEKLEFRKYIGIPKCFGTHTIIAEDWKLYSTNGSFTIVEKTMIDGRLVVKLKLNFTATYNGIEEYNFTNAAFETTL